MGPQLVQKQLSLVQALRVLGFSFQGLGVQGLLHRLWVCLDSRTKDEK